MQRLHSACIDFSFSHALGQQHILRPLPENISPKVIKLAVGKAVEAQSRELPSRSLAAFQPVI
jgi:hypothetical protein